MAGRERDRSRVLLPYLPAIIVPGAGGDDRLAWGKERCLLIAPVAGEEPSLHAMVRLPNDQ
jgi:hypothetical protein